MAFRITVTTTVEIQHENVNGELLGGKTVYTEVAAGYSTEKRGVLTTVAEGVMSNNEELLKVVKASYE